MEGVEDRVANGSEEAHALQGLTGVHHFSEEEQGRRLVLDAALADILERCSTSGFCYQIENVAVDSPESLFGSFQQHTTLTVRQDMHFL